MNQEGFERRIEVEQFSAPEQAIFKRGSVGGGHHVLTIHLPTQHFTGDRVGPKAKLVKTAPSQSKSGTFPHYLSHMLDSEFPADNAWLAKALSDLPNDVTAQYHQEVHDSMSKLIDFLGDDIPSKASPISHNSAKWHHVKLLNRLFVSSICPNIKAPGIEEFPMDVPSSSMGVSTVKSLSSDINSTIHPTGFYLEAGQSLHVNVKSFSGEGKSMVLIQCIES